jgi:peroxiredoxin
MWNRMAGNRAKDFSIQLSIYREAGGRTRHEHPYTLNPIQPFSEPYPMTAIAPLIPRRKAPNLEVPTVGGGLWRLSERKPENFTMLVFYRGLHCPQCKGYLKDLDNKAADFAAKGVDILVVSGDGEDRAKETKSDWRLDNLSVGYGLDLDMARQWGLYISAGIGTTSLGIEEPALFSEPGLFLVRPDGTLYFGSVQTMPFARPKFADLLLALDFVIARGYPARGEVVDHHRQAAE